VSSLYCLDLEKIMSFLDKFPKEPSPDEVLSELQRYLGTSASDPGSSGSNPPKGVKGKVKSQPVKATVQLSMEEMVHSGVWLIRHLPVARDAVFDFISITYDEFIKNYLSHTEVHLTDWELLGKRLRLRNCLIIFKCLEFCRETECRHFQITI